MLCHHMPSQRPPFCSHILFGDLFNFGFISLLSSFPHVLIWISVRCFTVRIASPEQTQNSGTLSIRAGRPDTRSPPCTVRVQSDWINHIRRPSCKTRSNVSYNTSFFNPSLLQSPTTASRWEPTNVARTTNSIAHLPLNGNPTVLRPVT
jgi:hypothetical protein